MILSQTPTFEQLPSFLVSLADEIQSIKQIMSNSGQSAKTEMPTGVKGAAEFTHLEEPTIYTLVRKKKIPFYKKNKRLYFFHSELQDWIKSGGSRTLDQIESDAENQFLEANKKRGGIHG